MQKKINKNYLGEALKLFDIDGNQIIDPQEWFSYFMSHQDIMWDKCKELITKVLKDVFPDENQERLPVLAEAIILNHSEESAEGKQINLIKLYNYINRFIAPQKYRQYQQSLDDKTMFFLYDGVIEKHEFEIFTDENNRLITADIYYFIISFNTEPEIASKFIDNIICEPSVEYNPVDFSLDADAVFSLMSLNKNGKMVIDIDSILAYAHKVGIDTGITQVLHLFGIHNDFHAEIKNLGTVRLEAACSFLNFFNKAYLELGVQTLCDALCIEMHNFKEMADFIDFLGYRGKPEKFFREVAGQKSHFDRQDLEEFLKDNNLKYTVK